MFSREVILRHYSRIKPISCIGVSGSFEGFFTVKFKETTIKKNEFFKGDPILVGVYIENNINITGGNIISVNMEQGTLILTTDKVVEVLTERREYIRRAVSIMANIKIEGSSNTSAFVKDLSYSGARIYTDKRLEVEDMVDLNIYMNSNVLSLDAKVIRTTTSFGRNEYGLQIIHRDRDIMFNAKKGIDKYLDDEAYMIEKHLTAIK